MIRFFIRLIKCFLLSILSLAVLAVCIFFVINLITEPSDNRSWSVDQAVLPYADIQGNEITLHNIRNFAYASTTEYTPNYYDKTFDLTKIKKAWYIVEPFTGFKGSAHTFLSFEFEDNSFVSVSIEIRKEKGESFSAVKGLFNKYELMYVVADERDVVKLRTNYRKDSVYMYPVKTSKEKTQALFVDIMKRVNQLKDSPEFYNTLFNNCTISIVRHINAISPRRVPFFSLHFVLPENSDRLAHDLGLLDVSEPFEQTRANYLINDKALKYANDPDFSVKIRE